MALIYNYSRETGELLSSKEARIDPMEPDKILIPAFATDLEPLGAEGNNVDVFENGQWTIKADYRGTTYTNLTGDEVVITQIGELVPDYSSEEYASDLKTIAYVNKLQALYSEKSSRNNSLPFVYNGIAYVNDEQNIIGVKVAVLDKEDSDPIPTFIGTENEGCWKTLDDTYTPMTNLEFRTGLAETYFVMRSTNFTNADVLKKAIDAIYNDSEATADDINSFDITQGWSESTYTGEQSE